jgi:hypothetical protein
LSLIARFLADILRAGWDYSSAIHCPRPYKKLSKPLISRVFRVVTQALRTAADVPKHLLPGFN